MSERAKESNASHDASSSKRFQVFRYGNYFYIKCCTVYVLRSTDRPFVNCEHWWGRWTLWNKQVLLIKWLGTSNNVQVQYMTRMKHNFPFETNKRWRLRFDIQVRWCDVWLHDNNHCSNKSTVEHTHKHSKHTVKLSRSFIATNYVF